MHSMSPSGRNKIEETGALPSERGGRFRSRPASASSRAGVTRPEVSRGSSGPANHHALYSHRSNAVHRSDARCPVRMSGDDTAPPFVHRNDSEHYGAPSGSRAQVTRSIRRSKEQTIWLSL